jgi:(E)-4-hydroxy-3-methylbut-2-enyl-diphosphate synthase
LSDETLAAGPSLLVYERLDDDFSGAVDTLLSWSRQYESVRQTSFALGFRLGSVAATVRAGRLLAGRLQQSGRANPIHLISPPADSFDDLQLGASVALGSLLCDGIGDSVEIRWNDAADAVRLGFNVLQAAGARITKTEYVACPGCGRTLFELQPTTDRIKSRTGHLVGVKIAVMGCIVNGPGEMADADFGYVGGAPGKVNLYVGKECVERNVPQAEADDRLIALIQAHGRWVDPG